MSINKHRSKNTNRFSSIPHITGVITFGSKDRSLDCFKIDGPLDKELEKIMRKYGKVVLYAPYIATCIALYGTSWMMAGAMLTNII
jgi:hypothetical protein